MADTATIEHLEGQFDKACIKLRAARQRMNRNLSARACREFSAASAVYEAALAALLAARKAAGRSDIALRRMGETAARREAAAVQLTLF